LKKRIFHPKLYIFQNQNGKKSAILGSSNLTEGGLSKNYEANVQVDSHIVAQELSDYFDEHFQGAYSEDLTGDWLEDYAKEWSKRKKLLDKLRELPPKKVRSKRRKAEESVEVPSRIKGYRF